MAVRRDKNTGETIEEPTRKVGSDRNTQAHGGMQLEPNTRRVNDERARRVYNADVTERESLGYRDAISPFEAPTQKIDVEQRQEDTSDRTRLVRPQGDSVERSDKDPMADPVVGWLVIIDGPGKGQVCRLGYGSNSLGRGGASRVRIDYGDDRISREDHATVTYDSRGRKFYLLHGGGKNLTYLGDDPVLAPTLLEAMTEFSIGHTTLRFVPLCGPNFDWEDVENK